MAKTKTTLEHVVYGAVEVKSAWLLASDERYLECVTFKDSQKVTRKLLIAAEYWISDAATVEKAHDLLFAKELLRRKTLASKSHSAESQNTKKQYVAPDRRQRNADAVAKEIERLESHIADLQEIPDEDDNTESTSVDAEYDAETCAA